MSDDTLVYTVAEAADLLSCSEDKVQELIRERRIPFVDLGPRTRIIPREALKVWLLAEAELSLVRPVSPARPAQTLPA